MPMPVRHTDFALGIILRYTRVASAEFPEADLFFASGHEEPLEQGPLWQSVQNLYLINRALTENKIFNFRLQLSFLGALLGKTVGETGLITARRLAMAEKLILNAARTTPASQTAPPPIYRFMPFLGSVESERAGRRKLAELDLRMPLKAGEGGGGPKQNKPAANAAYTPTRHEAYGHGSLPRQSDRPDGAKRADAKINRLAAQDMRPEGGAGFNPFLPATLSLLIPAAQAVQERAGELRRPGAGERLAKERAVLSPFGLALRLRITPEKSAEGGISPGGRLRSAPLTLAPGIPRLAANGGVVPRAGSPPPPAPTVPTGFGSAMTALLSQSGYAAGIKAPRGAEFAAASKSIGGYADYTAPPAFRRYHPGISDVLFAPDAAAIKGEAKAARPDHPDAVARRERSLRNDYEGGAVPPASPPLAGHSEKRVPRAAGNAAGPAGGEAAILLQSAAAGTPWAPRLPVGDGLEHNKVPARALRSGALEIARRYQPVASGPPAGMAGRQNRAIPAFYPDYAPPEAQAPLRGIPAAPLRSTPYTRYQADGDSGPGSPGAQIPPTFARAQEYPGGHGLSYAAPAIPAAEIKMADKADIPGASILYRTEPEPRGPRQDAAATTINKDIEFIKKTVKQTKTSESKESNERITANMAINKPGAGGSHKAPVNTPPDLDRQVNAIADKVYGVLERRLRSERMRKGFF
ncbi:MAG: hypothetical protein LBU86_00965 [Oscillospiraceae bacterium]|jgi:hypothetical protein|nr:hypothetical protein [Oscillospiraceae bacterium]